MSYSPVRKYTASCLGLQRTTVGRRTSRERDGGYLNLGDTEGGRGHPLELELAQLPVAAGNPALTSIDDKGHVGLVVMHCGEDLLAVARHSEGGGDEHMLLVPNHGNAHRWPLLRQLPALEHVLVGGCACGPAQHVWGSYKSHI